MADHKSVKFSVPFGTLREELARETCCLICLRVVPPDKRKQHKRTAAHSVLTRYLKREIFPYPCSLCEMRFSSDSQLFQHFRIHNEQSAIEGNEVFNPVCCYLCRLPFDSQEELDKHCWASVEHQCRRQMVIELALRESKVSELSNVHDSLTESFSSSGSAVPTVQENLKDQCLRTPSNSMDIDQLLPMFSKLSVTSGSVRNDEAEDSMHSDNASSEALIVTETRVKNEDFLCPQERVYFFEGALCSKDSNAVVTDLNIIAKDAFKDLPSSKSAVRPVLQEDPQTNLFPWQKEVLSSGQTACLICSVAVPKCNMTEHMKGARHIKKAQRTKGMSGVNVTLKSNQNYIKGEQLQSKVTSLEIPKAEIAAIPGATEIIKLGDSSAACLQEQFEEIVLSEDLNDYQVECETCGAEFQIFNNNLDLSYALHVQNDPQHGLAIAVPLERDAKRMAELVQTSTAPKKETKKVTESKSNGLTHCFVCFENLCAFSSQARVQHISRCKARSLNRAEQLTIQARASNKKVTESKSNGLTHCFVCFENLCAFSSQARVQHISRCKARSFNRAEQLTIQARASNTPSVSKTNSEGNSMKLPVPASSQPVQPVDNSSEYWCQICDKKMTRGNRRTHEISKKHKEEKAKIAKQIQGAIASENTSNCSKSMTESEKDGRLKNQLHKEEAALKFFCKVCNRTMHQDSKSSHLQGKDHRKALMKPLSKQIQGAIASENTSNCSKSMTESEKDGRLKNQLHKEEAALKFFCKVCNRTMHQDSKSSHLQGKDHRKALMKPLSKPHFYCDICDKTMGCKDKSSHLEGKDHKAKSKTGVPILLPSKSSLLEGKDHKAKSKTGVPILLPSTHS